MPYQSSGGRRNNVQIGVGRSLWGGTPPSPIPERVLDGIPGFLAWLALLLCIASAIAFPRGLLLIAGVLGFYSALRFFFAGIANGMGLRQIRQWERTNWYQRYLDERNQDTIPWEAVHHLILIPNYKEPLPILRKTLENLARQFNASTQMTIVLAMEGGEVNCAAKAEQLIREYHHAFANFYYTVHPTGLPGEIRGKSSNEAWAARWAKRKLVDELGYNIDHMVISTMDADTMWHPKYFEALTYLFAIRPDRHIRFWQSPIRYHGNIWDISPVMRLVNAYSTALELAYLAAPWWSAMPISSYSLSLRLMDSSGYWDADVIAEDWHMYIKAFFASNAELILDPIFLPFLATATTGDTWWEAVKNRYQQTLRHAWGSKEVGYIIAKILEHPEIDFRPAMRLLFRVAHDILLAGAGWVIITAGSQLPLLLYPNIMPSVGAILSDPVENFVFFLFTLSFALVITMGIVFWVQDVIVRPPRKAPLTLQEAFWTLISFPLLPVLTLIFVALPVMQAQTRLLIGISLQYRVARKL
ncbi:MAG: hypothetical protein MUF87_18840 [Anaerolineae bacterium]|nr:hypothetical protein [Anaerolineae bacterium]